LKSLTLASRLVELFKKFLIEMVKWNFFHWKTSVFPSHFDVSPGKAILQSHSYHKGAEKLSWTFQL